jgi:hypothetical protein
MIMSLRGSRLLRWLGSLNLHRVLNGILANMEIIASMAMYVLVCIANGRFVVGMTTAFAANMAVDVGFQGEVIRSKIDLSES